MTTVPSHEMNAISHLMVANDHYTITGLRELVDTYNHPELSQALDCVMEEGTIDTILKFFIESPHVYPEAQVLNNVHNHHVMQQKAMLAYSIGQFDYLPLAPEVLLDLTPTETYIQSF